VSIGIPKIALLAAWLALLAGGVAAGADGAPDGNTNRPAILVLGDSLAAGYGVDPGRRIRRCCRRRWTPPG